MDDGFCVELLNTTDNFLTKFVDCVVKMSYNIDKVLILLEKDCFDFQRKCSMKKYDIEWYWIMFTSGIKAK